MREEDLESVFLRLEELVLANSGEDPFEEIFKLLVAKLWDEFRYAGSPLFRPSPRPAEARAALQKLIRGATSEWPGILGDDPEPLLTDGHLAVCMAALSGHRLLDASFEVMDSLFEFLISRSAKGAKGQYFTPRHVVEFCTKLTNPTSDETVCDPACGSGGFLIHALRHVVAESAPGSGGLRAVGRDSIWGFDIDPRAVRVAKALMLLAGDGHTNIYRLNSLLRPNVNVDLFEGDSERDGTPFLTIENVVRSRDKSFRGFDVVMTNPPFAGEIKEKHILESYSLFRRDRRIERDVLFIERCVELLKPGGRLAIVLPHNKLGSAAWSYARAWLLRQIRVLGAIGLGRNTFLPHTHQKADVLIGVKRAKPCRDIGGERILFAVSERDGKNSRGQFLLRKDGSEGDALWQRVDHDLDQIAEAFSEFYQTEFNSDGNALWHTQRLGK
jgi:type I restriction enzyme M protein